MKATFFKFLKGLLSAFMPSQKAALQPIPVNHKRRLPGAAHWLGALVVGLSLFSFTSAQAHTANAAVLWADDDTMVKQDRKVGDFSALEVSSAISVKLSQGNESAVTVEAGQNVINKVETKVSGGKLIIRYSSSGDSWFRSRGKVTVYVTAKVLNGIDCSGASSITGLTAISAGKLAIEASGASSIKLELKAQSVAGDFSGASSVNLTGSTGGFTAEVSGASSIKAADLVAKDAVVDVSGASSVFVHATNTLVAEASGASSVRYKGTAKVTPDVSGASSIKPL